MSAVIYISSSVKYRENIRHMNLAWSNSYKRCRISHLPLCPLKSRRYRELKIPVLISCQSSPYQGWPCLQKSSYFEVLERSHTEEEAQVMQVNPEPCWIDLILRCLRNRTLPTDHDEARKLSCQAPLMSFMMGNCISGFIPYPCCTACIHPKLIIYSRRYTKVSMIVT